MYKLKKDGLVRIVATEAEAQRWRKLGYEDMGPVAGPTESGQTDGGGETDPLDAMDAEVLKQYAIEHSIDIGNATSQNGILKKIREAQTQVGAGGA